MVKINRMMFPRLTMDRKMRNLLILGCTLLLLLCGIPHSAFAQGNIDSLKKQLTAHSKDKNDSLYQETILELVNIHRDFDVAKAIQYANNGLDLAKKTGNQDRIGFWYGTLGDLYVLHDEQLLALEAFHSGMDSARAMGANTGWWNISIGNVYFSDNLNLKKAEHHYELAIRDFQKLGANDNAWSGIAVAFNNIGLVHESFEKYDTAVMYYKKGLQIRELIGDSALIRHSYSVLAVAFMKFDVDSSRYYFNLVDSLTFNEKDRFDYYLNVSELYRKTGEYKEATDAISQAEKIAQKSHMLTFLPLVYREYSDICIDRKQYAQAINYSRKGLKLAENEQLINYALPLLDQLVSIYSAQEDYKNAFKYQKEYVDLKDSLHEDQVKNAEVNYELEENQREVNFLKENLNNIIKHEHKLEDVKHQLEDENKRQHDTLLTFEWGFILALIMGIFLFLSFHRQRKQKAEIKQAHDEVLSSIKYAETIQNAIFPKSDMFDFVFKDHFLISRAKENLSGDFYYLKITGKNIVVALGDCTGHGVPGALLSVLGISFLNEIIRREEVNTPGSALEQMKYHINQNFQNSINGDGMDIGLLTIGKDDGIVNYAGAYIPLYIVRKGELITIKASKSSIGSNYTNVPFEDHTFKLESGDKLYMFSDGFTDQFGTDGGRVRKFSRKRLLELLTLHSEKDMSEQKKILTYALENWSKGQEQTDDISVLGFQWN